MQDCGGDVLVQPAQHGLGVVLVGQVVVQGLQLGMDPFGVVGEQLTESLPQRTAPAPARAVLGVLAASWAGMPGTGWPGAGSTQRFGQGPAAYESNLAADGAARPALLAGVTPRLPGDRGDLTGSRTPADRAGHRLGGTAGVTQWAVGGAGADCASAPAADSGLLVGGVGDHAVGAQRSSVLVAGGRVAVHAAARAGLCPGLGHTVAAQPDPVAWFDQGQDPSAVRAAWAGDDVCPGPDEPIDQSQYRGPRCSCAGSGERLGVILQRPRQTLALPSAGRGGQHRPGDRLGREVGLELGDDAEQGLGRVLVGFGPARDAVRALLTVADTNRPELPAVGARLGFGTACPAVPVLPATLQASQRLAAVGAYGCRDVARACVTQRDEQVPDHGRCRGTPVAQQ